jgi:hypothetical protein
MARKHALLISLVVAGALVAGVFAAVRTTELGASASAAPSVSGSDISRRDHQLDRLAKQIEAHARKRPPKLPKLRVPAASGSGVAAASASSGTGAAANMASTSDPGPSSSDSSYGDDQFDDHGDDDESDDHGDDDEVEAGDDHGDHAEPGDDHGHDGEAEDD